MKDVGALYIISVAARLVGLHVQTLRKYERFGLLEPSRTAGKLRLYSPHDVGRLWQIKRLVENRGINLAGVELMLEITDRIRNLLDEIDGVQITHDVEPGPGTQCDADRQSRIRSRLAAILRLLEAAE